MQFLGGAVPRAGGNGRGGLTARSRMRHPADVVEYHNEAFAVVAGTGGDVLEDAVDAECVQGVAVLALCCLLVKTRTYPMTAINSIGDMHQTLKTLGESNPRVAPEQGIRTGAPGGRTEHGKTAGHGTQQCGGECQCDLHTYRLRT